MARPFGQPTCVVVEKCKVPGESSSTGPLLKDDGFNTCVAFPAYYLTAIADDPFQLLRVPHTNAFKLTDGARWVNMDLCSCQQTKCHGR
eukprot:3260753-Amphidinium_carterae.1